MSATIPRKDQAAESTTPENRKTILERLTPKKLSPSLSKGAKKPLESTKITPLHLAAEDGNVDNLEQILLSDESILDSQTHEDMTALAIAAENGSADVVRSLLKRKPALELRNQNGMTALHLAAQNGNEDIVRQLLLAGTFEKTSGTPGASAPLQKDQKSRVNAVGGSIISNVDMLDKNSRTPLFLASERGNVSVVKLLLDSGADSRLSDKRGRMPIEAAALAGKREVTELLKLRRGRGSKSASSMGHWIRLSSDKNLDLGMIVANRKTMQQIGTHVAPPVELLGTIPPSPGFIATLDEVKKGRYSVWADFLGLRLADRFGKEADSSLEVEAFEVTFFNPSDEYVESSWRKIDPKSRESAVYMVTGTRVARLGSAKASEEQRNPSASILLAVRLHEISPKKSLFSGRRTKT